MFFKKIGILASQQHQQAVILSGMVFTLVIWIFGALSLLLALLFYLLFLWHAIPNADGGLSGYCERKVNRSLAKIVSEKVNKAIEDEERRRIKADIKATKKGEKLQGRQATLPTLFDPKTDDKLPQMPMLNRNDTMATLPAYSSRPGTPSGQPTLPAFELDSLDQKRPFASRTVTGSSAMSTTSFGSNAPLVGNASDMGYGRSGSPAPSLPPLDTNGYPLPPQRSLTGNSNVGTSNRTPPGGPPRMPSAMGDRGYTSSPVSYNDGESPSGSRPGFAGQVDSYGRPVPRAVNELSGRSTTPAGPAPSLGRRTPFDPEMNRSNTPGGPAPSMGRRTPFDQNYPGGRSSPAPISPSDYGRNSPAPNAMGRGSNSPIDGGYQSYNPNMRSASAAPRGPLPNPNYPPSTRSEPQYRNITDPGPRGSPPGGDYFSNANAPPIPRTGTAQSQNGRLAPLGNGNGNSGGNTGPGDIRRLASPAPYNGGGPGSPQYGSGSPMYRR